QASDGDTAQVGPGISAHLNIPQVTYVKKIEEVKGNIMRVERMMEEGFEIIETPLPALLTVVKEINEPRLPSLKGMMRAKSAKIALWTQKELNLDPQKLGLCGSPTQVVKIFTPTPRAGGQKLTGEIPEIATALVDLLKDEVH
ncbi:MAG: electron transfer flavoprotein subunit beta/FixA family protein, partial [Candidatus Omnitrophica bacterium]|nr:electron transfer flavoprotein subunit beta/FixA family protein [Candidatus Omnitrophota bacterium]